MPCLNEAETVETCVAKAAGFLREHGIDGEVLVADNGSTDGSQRLAEQAGARVVPVAEKGYGNALMGGIVAARGRYVIMADADGRSRPPHLRSWRDGWRHLRFLLLFSPRWLFLIPGIALLAIALLIGAAVAPGPLSVGPVSFDVDTMVGASAMLVIGFQAVLFALFTKIYASAEGFLPQDRWAKRVLRVWSLERGLVAGVLLGVAGLVGVVVSISQWKVARFGPLHPTHSLRIMVPSATALVVSCQVIFGTFFISILGIRRTRHPAAEAPVEDEARRADASESVPSPHIPAGKVPEAAVPQTPVPPVGAAPAGQAKQSKSSAA